MCITAQIIGILTMATFLLSYHLKKRKNIILDNAKERFVVHDGVDGGGHGWQKMISRMELYGEISKDRPSSIARLGKGTCYVSEAMAKPFSHWFYGIQPKDL